MAALFRIVIAELPRFPELGEAHFERGKMPYFDSVRRYLDTANALERPSWTTRSWQRPSSSG